MFLPCKYGNLSFTMQLMDGYLDRNWTTPLGVTNPLTGGLFSQPYRLLGDFHCMATFCYEVLFSGNLSMLIYCSFWNFFHLMQVLILIPRCGHSTDFPSTFRQVIKPTGHRL